MISPADRPTLVLLHSSGSTPRQWQELVETVRPDFRVLAVEFHGHGSRPAWAHARPMTLADDAALVTPLLESTGGAHVVGHSYGGAVALKLACMHPGLVRSMVAYEPVLFRLLFEDTAHPKDARDVLQAVGRMRSDLRAGHAARAARTFVEFWSGPGAWAAMPERAQQVTAERMPSILRHFDALFQEPFPRDDLARSSTPMLFLAGSRTVPAAHRIAYHLRKALPLAQHAELPGLGHMGPVVRPHAVNECIREFLSSLPRLRAGQPDTRQPSDTR